MSSHILIRLWAFATPVLAQRLNVMTMPSEWANSEVKDDSVHLLSFPFMFSQTTLISYFRAINYAAMNKAFQTSVASGRLAKLITFTENETGPGSLRADDSLRIAQTGYLVLVVRREYVLTDAIDQLWRRQHRELMRPLKVEMGSQEGEQGLDHGGVQQEFFRMVITEVMNPDYGIFTTDPISGMSWFKPGSLEPEYRYELLGLFASLAIYNGVTLPFNFPNALYRKLLDLTVRLEDLADGWPQLTKGLKDLRDYEGDVEETFIREYVFSIDVFGTTINTDISRRSSPDKTSSRPQSLSPKSSARVSSDREERKSNLEKRQESDLKIEDDSVSETPITPTSPSPQMVNNDNRDQYIIDYIHHLIDVSIATQHEHFTRGFFRCISRKTIGLFDPWQLKDLVEGCPFIDITRLRRFTQYENGYHALHPTIGSFWKIVQDWDQEKVGRLLEFVTASDRLPIGGESRVNFIIQKNGEGDERLPTSLTCFGRLLLPEYRSVERMEKALDLAVENAKGFGTP
ncbi:hypothetical protein P7C71_g4015, partial [Lecanoromycetidae sp. Uapishka_2]